MKNKNEILLSLSIINFLTENNFPLKLSKYIKYYYILIIKK